MLLNLSNHPSANWPAEQMNEAIKQYGAVQDLPFPKIDPKAASDEVEQLAEAYETKVRQQNPTAVHIMGEMTFTFNLVTKLKAMGIPCIASTTERIAEEENGSKISLFKFVRFRSY
ncbi:MAG: CRISPR-associated protein [Bacteroidetes bacterium]|nr:CRISPR-associated protein [Bacteroidota bacterium]